MNIKKKLANPFALVAQGFAAGALLFFASTAFESEPAAPQRPGQSAAVADTLDA